MGPSRPVTPAPAVTGPFTGGQYAAQEPLQTDLVGVSGANEYRVNPRALASTLTPPIWTALSPPPALAVAGALAPATATPSRTRATTDRPATAQAAPGIPSCSRSSSGGGGRAGGPRAGGGGGGGGGARGG